MSRLSDEQIYRINKLIQNKKSLNEIVFELGINKTTVYYHLRKIRGKKTQSITLNLSDRERIGEIIGVFAGDGYYKNNPKRWDKRILIYFNANETSVINYYRDSFKKLISKSPGVIRSGSVKIVQVCSKDFCQFVLSYVNFGRRKVQTIELKDKSLLKEKEFTIGFIRGLIDSDGYVRRDRKEIYYGSISKNLFNDFLNGLNLFGFKYKTYLQKSKHCDFYKVRISGNEVDNFVKLIRPAKSL